MSDNTACEAKTATSSELRGWARAMREIRHEPTGISFTPAAITSRIEATADALDALREAVKGCGKSLGADACGSPAYFVDEVGPQLCAACRAKRDAAIDRLLGESGNG